MIDKNYIHPKRFKWDINNNISPSMLSFWQKNGFLIIDNFYSVDECEGLKNRAELLIENHSPENEIPYSLNNYDMKNESFKFSANNIVFFHEDNNCKELQSISKNEGENIKEIGHAIHDLDPTFSNFSRKKSLAILLTSLGIEMPLLAKSTYILKHSDNDKYSYYNQDSSILYTEPESCIGCTISLENETIENGCLWTFSQGHLGPLKKRYFYNNQNFEILNFNNSDFPEPNIVLQSYIGTLIIQHGRLPCIFKMRDKKLSQHSYKINIIDGRTEYSKNNIFNREPSFKFSGFFISK